MKRKQLNSRMHSNSGFTLIELLVALVSFSLLLSLSYQALQTMLQVQERVVESIDLQHQTRITYRTLRDAVGSGGRIKVSSNRLEIDLSSGVSPWSLSRQAIRFEILDGKDLWQFDDSRLSGIKLLGGAHGLRFKAVTVDGSYDEAREPYMGEPEAVRLSWLGVLASSDSGPSFNSSSVSHAAVANPQPNYWLFLVQ